MVRLLCLLIIFAFNTDYASAEIKSRIKEPYKTKKTSKKRSRKSRKKKSSRKKRSYSKPKKEEAEEINLAELDSKGSSYGAPNASTAPVFKAYFDIFLKHRPHHPTEKFTFDNSHKMLLVDFIPNPDIHLSMDIPLLRFYEADINITDNLKVRVGKIWIAFDDMEPHNLYGGYVNTSDLRQPGSVAFLPDIWADLGVGLQYQLYESQTFSLVTDVSVTNGFGDGGTDPVNAASTYPDFSNPVGDDNNADKALNLQAEAEFGTGFALGASIYTCQYSDFDDESLRMMMLGVHTRLSLPWDTVLRAGYINMQVGIPRYTDAAGAEVNSFQRAGIYAELRKRLNRKWELMGRGGILQGDDRLEDLNDQTNIGAAITHIFNPMFRLSLEGHTDIKDVAGKSSKSFMGLRFVMMM